MLSTVIWMKNHMLNIYLANDTLLIRLYKTFIRPCMDFVCTGFIALNKSQKHRLEVVQNRCLHYTTTAVASTCISNKKRRSCCNLVSVEQRILALANNLWKKTSGNIHKIVNFAYHHQINTNTKAPLNITKSNNRFL